MATLAPYGWNSGGARRCRALCCQLSLTPGPLICLAPPFLGLPTISNPRFHLCALHYVFLAPSGAVSHSLLPLGPHACPGPDLGNRPLHAFPPTSYSIRVQI